MTLRQKILNDMVLSDKKKIHTLSVEKCAQELRKRHFPHISEEKTSIAALLHDFTKEYSDEKQFELCREYGVKLTEQDKRVTKILHSKTAAAIAKNIYDVDNETENAIFRHTTGGKNMTELDIIIYFADYIEEKRISKGCIAVRDYYNSLLKEDIPHLEALYRGLLLSFDTTIKMILRKKELIHTPTFEARNWIIEKISGRKI